MSRVNTLTGNVTLLKSALEGLGISVGEALVAPLRVAVHAISKAVSAISDWGKRNREPVFMVGDGGTGNRRPHPQRRAGLYVQQLAKRGLEASAMGVPVTTPRAADDHILDTHLSAHP